MNRRYNPPAVRVKQRRGRGIFRKAHQNSGGEVVFPSAAPLHSLLVTRAVRSARHEGDSFWSGPCGQGRGREGPTGRARTGDHRMAFQSRDRMPVLVGVCLEVAVESEKGNQLLRGLKKIPTLPRRVASRRSAPPLGAE